MQKFVLCAAVLAAFAPLASAQEARGTILGRVTDPQDAVIANATIQVTNIATGLTANLHTNDQGNYQAPYLTLGMYKITAEAKGFKKIVRENIEVRVNDQPVDPLPYLTGAG